MATKSMPVNEKRQLIKTFETRNLAMATGLFHKYNSMTRYSATISKKKGGDNSYSYVVQIYSIYT